MKYGTRDFRITLFENGQFQLLEVTEGGARQCWLGLNDEHTIQTLREVLAGKYDEHEQRRGPTHKDPEKREPRPIEGFGKLPALEVPELLAAKAGPMPAGMALLQGLTGQKQPMKEEAPA